MQQQQRCWGVVPAAGIGSRMNAGMPKQYLELAGKTILEHSVNALLANTRIAGVVVALHPGDTRAMQLPVFDDTRIEHVEGGEQRSDSVLAALVALLARGEPRDWVLVHDAARPCLPADDLALLIDRVIIREMGGILAAAIADTVKLADEEGLVERTLDRARLWRAQTPQMFRLGELHGAIMSAQRQGVAITDEASAMELAGHQVQLVPGSQRNLKITQPGDLPLASWYLGEEGVDS